MIGQDEETATAETVANDVPTQSENATEAKDVPSEEELAAARELAEHNALADVFDDVRKQSADSHLATPERWPEIGLVPDHMTAEDFEMFVYEWLEEYQAEHADEIEAERAAERAKAASIRSATHAVGVPPKIRHRRLAQIQADEQAKQSATAQADGVDEAQAPKVQAGKDGAVQADEAAATPSPASPSAVVTPSLSEPAGPAAEASDLGAGKSPAPSSESDDSGLAATNDAGTRSDSPASTDGEGPSAAAASGSASGTSDDADDASPFAGLHIPDGYKLEQIEGQWTLVEDPDAAPVRKEIKCNRIKVLMGMHSYYLYDETLMTDSYARWAFLAAEDNPVVTFVECVREDSRVYPRPYAADSLKNPPFRMTDEQIEQTWQTVHDSGNYPDIERTQASNGDVYYYSTKYLEPRYAASLAEYAAVERPASV